MTSGVLHPSIPAAADFFCLQVCSRSKAPVSVGISHSCLIFEAKGQIKETNADLDVLHWLQKCHPSTIAQNGLHQQDQ